MNSFINSFFIVLKIAFPGFLFFLGSIPRVYGQFKVDSIAYKLHPLQIKQDFNINGKLTNPVWRKAKPIYLSNEIIPNDQASSPVKTKVKVLYSDHYLYIGFWAQDPTPSKIRAHIADRDQIGGDDFVLIFLDPFKSNQYAYTFAVNPQGVQFDTKWSPSGHNPSFNMIWFSKADINDSGYTVAMKIPFKSIHFPGTDIQNWAINFLRKYPRSHRNLLAWTNISIGNSCLLCQNGRLVGITGIEHSNPVDIIPYVVGYKSGALNDPGDPVSGLNSGPVDGRIGGTIIYSPTSTSTIDAAINPDFSQVETDATKIGVNKTFALFYTEKRPFFLKKANTFKGGYDLFYSRTINRPWAAGKYTQTANNYSIGFLTAYDRNTPFIVPGLMGSSTVESDVNAYDNILRGKYNIGSQSYIGGLVTTRNETGGHNYVGSIDWKFFLGHHFYFSGAAAYSDTKELNNTALFNNSRQFGQSHYDAAFNGQQYGGRFLDAEFERLAKYYSFSFEYKALAPTFQTQNGFITQTDRRVLEASQEFDYYLNNKWLSRGGVSVNGSWRYDFANIFKERWIGIEWFNTFAAQTQLSIQYLPLNDETFRGRFFSKMNRLSISVSSRPVKFISFGASLQTGRSIYRTAHPKMGHGYSFSTFAVFKPVPRLKLDLTYSYSTLSPLDDSGAFYSGSISRLEGHYNFSRHLFFRLIAQYNSFSKQIQVYPLLYYKLNPFTKIYLGMTDNLQHVNRFGPPRINGYRQVNREFFIKIQYLFRK